MTLKPIQQSAQATAVAGAVTSILLWAAKQYGHADLPPDIQAAILVIIMTVVTHFVDDKPVTPDPPTPPEKSANA